MPDCANDAPIGAPAVLLCLFFVATAAWLVLRERARPASNPLDHSTVSPRVYRVMVVLTLGAVALCAHDWWVAFSRVSR